LYCIVVVALLKLEYNKIKYWSTLNCSNCTYQCK